MDITPLTPKGKPIIQRYGKGEFVISAKSWPHSVLITADGVQPWHISDQEQLQAYDFSALIAELQAVEIFLLGTGVSSLIIPTDVRQQFRARKIALEVMDTGAACRTYNILLSEGRLVGAALVAV